jgi:hypothetical protein
MDRSQGPHCAAGLPAAPIRQSSPEGLAVDPMWRQHMLDNTNYAQNMPSLVRRPLHRAGSGRPRLGHRGPEESKAATGQTLLEGYGEDVERSRKEMNEGGKEEGRGGGGGGGGVGNGNLEGSGRRENHGGRRGPPAARAARTREWEASSLNPAGTALEPLAFPHDPSAKRKHFFF